MTTAAWICLLSPLAAALVITLAGTRISRRMAGRLATLSTFVSFGAAVWAFVLMLGRAGDDRREVSTAWTWLTAGELRFDLSILVDPLSVFMMLVISGVGSLIVGYSIGYMDGDDEERRYFAYMALFVFSMLLLVQSANFLLLLAGWGLVGLASYLLIGFNQQRPSAVAAAKKAFIMNAIGDATIALALFLLIWEVGSLSLDFTSGGEGVPLDGTVATLVALGLLGGAVAKSAQIPLHTWLPDAMEGPTPVSALIHAATMVTAGVYLIARMFPFFELAPTAADISAFVGLATLIVAATIALVVTDLKRIIAYSTMSQIGYMIVGVSIGAYAAGLFHLMTHAFFKALLFMAAGSVIAAMANRQNIDGISGFRRALPLTSALLIIGALALAGFPGMSGFFSKDEILVFAAERGGMYWIFAIGGYIAAFLTAFYAFRIGFRVVLGEPCAEARELERGHLVHGEPENPLTGEREDTDVGFPGPEHHIAERARPMAIAMGILGVLSVLGGVLQVPGVTSGLEHFFEPTFEESAFHELIPSSGSAWLGLAVGGAVAIAGIALAYVLYVARPGVTVRLAERFSGLHGFFFNRWYLDALQDALVYRPLVGAGHFANAVFERFVVNGIGDGAAGVVRGAGSIVRGAQSGFVRGYALLLVGGFAVLGVYFLAAAS